MRKTTLLLASMATASVLAISAVYLLSSVFLSSADAEGPVRLVTSTIDTKIVQDAPHTNHGGVARLGVDGDAPTGSGKDNAALIKWDLSSIAPGTKIGSASVTLNVTNSSNQTYEAYALKRTWVESRATWREYAGAKLWEVSGARGSLDRGATGAGTITPSARGKRIFVIQSRVVQRWVDQPRSNRGIIIASSGNADGFDFRSGESATAEQRPRLRVRLGTEPILVGAGDIAGCHFAADSATANLLEGIPGTVFTVGDNAYHRGTAAEFADCYDPTWGHHKWRTMPSVGNHEYATAGAAGYFDYFGAKAGDPGEGYYSYDIGAWHVVSLNSMCEQVGGCGTTSPMLTWLKNDLAASRKNCTLAYWHHPLFSSGHHGSEIKMKPAYQVLYDNGAEVVINGHDHNYERFAPQDPDGVATAQGIRQFVVGTGGISLRPFSTTIVPNSVIRNASSHGVLKLTLQRGSYDWKFVPITGRTFTDSGSGSCHNALHRQ